MLLVLIALFSYAKQDGLIPQRQIRGLQAQLDSLLLLDNLTKANLDSINLFRVLIDANTNRVETDPFYALDSNYIKSHIRTDLDLDPTNELDNTDEQTITISNDTIYLQNGGFVVIPDYTDSLSYNSTTNYLVYYDYYKAAKDSTYIYFDGFDGLHSSLTLDDGTNPHGTTKSDIGLGNVENTAASTLYEPIFSKNTAFNKNFGTTSGTTAQGNDSRFHSTVTLNTTSYNYLSLSGQEITLGVIDYDTDITNKPTQTQFADKEVPSGLINSINTSYTLANTPTTGSDHVFLNGILQDDSSDYSITGAVITFTIAPKTGDKLVVTYRY